jgi:hypothetical protein
MLKITLAACYSIYEKASGLNGSSWDSMAGLLALAMSSLTKALRNTCIGISQLATKKLVVRVGAPQADHLELGFTASSKEHYLLSKNFAGKSDAASWTVYAASVSVDVVNFELNRFFECLAAGAAKGERCKKGQTARKIGFLKSCRERARAILSLIVGDYIHGDTKVIRPRTWVKTLSRRQMSIFRGYVKPS